MLTALALTGCGGMSLGGGQGCTMIGATRAVRVEVRPPLAAKAADATVDVCWDRICRTSKMALHASTASDPQDCTGGADTPCSATASPTGSKEGFAEVRDLPESRVQITLTLLDARGKNILRQRIDTTPHVVHPNGPDCDGEAPQVSLVVADGRVTALRP